MKVVQSNGFWSRIAGLVAASEIVIDRRRGSTHPRMRSVIYPLDYGYLRGTISGDGQGIDVWLGTLRTGNVTGVLCTVDTYKKDAEIKILVRCSRAEKRRLLAFHNQGDQAAVLFDAP